MAKASGTDLAGFESQFKTTQLFAKPADAVAFTKDAKLPKTMEFVAKFLLDHGIFGQGSKGSDSSSCSPAARPSATRARSSCVGFELYGDGCGRQALAACRGEAHPLPAL